MNRELTKVLGEVRDKRIDALAGDPLPMAALVQYPNRVTDRNQTRTRRVVVQGTISRFRVLAEELAAIEALLADYVVTTASR